MTGGINVVSKTVKVNVKALYEDSIIPAKANKTDAGFDLAAHIDVGDFFSTDRTQILMPGKRALIRTGFAIQLPEGLEMQIRPKSGHAYKAGITVLNSPGTIDSGYKGEVKVIVINHGEKPFVITHGMLIAQAVIQTLPDVDLEAVDELSGFDRGGGFGHTGDGPITGDGTVTGRLDPTVPHTSNTPKPEGSDEDR
jgi:dUTP pyrophosphatase